MRCLLLQTSPELFGKLLLGDEMSTARSTAPPASASQQPGGSKSLRALQSAGRPASHRVPSRGGQLAATYDTPRGFGDEPMTIDQELAIELESVKRERQQLMESIAQVKAEAGEQAAPVEQSAHTPPPTSPGCGAVGLTGCCPQHQQVCPATVMPCRHRWR